MVFIVGKLFIEPGVFNLFFGSRVLNPNYFKYGEERPFITAVFIFSFRGDFLDGVFLSLCMVED